MSEREEGMEEDEGMPSLVDASDDEEIQVAQELMAVDSDSDSQQSNRIPPPQEPAASAGEGGNLPGIRQVLQTAGQDAPVTFSMTFTLPLAPAPPPPASTTQPATADNNNNDTPRRDPSTLLQALFGLLGGHGGPRPEDPARARTIVRGMEAVSEGMVKRLVNAEEGTCAVCMECLQDEGSFGQDEPSSSSTEAPSSSTDTPSEPAEPLPRIVALPCAHVFHTACLLPWLARQTTCPNCRFDLDPDSLTLSIPPQSTNAPGHGMAQFLTQLFNGPVPPFVRQEGGREALDAFFADLDARTTPVPPPPPQPRPTLATLPTAALERALVNAGPEVRAAIEDVLEQRREASQVLRDLGMPPASTPQPVASGSGPRTPTRSSTASGIPPPPNMPATPPTPNIPANLSPAAQALLQAHHNRLQTEVYTAQAAAYRQQAEQYRREAQQYRQEAQQYREEAQMYREEAAAIGEGTQSAEGTPERGLQRLMEMHQQRMAARATASVPQPAPAAPQPAPPTQPQGEGAGPTQPGQGPLLSVFARQFADILQRGIMEGMNAHGGQPGTPNAPTPAQTQPAPAQPATPGPATSNAQPQQRVHQRTAIHIFPFTPGQGQAPPAPPPGFSYVDIVLPGGGAQPFTLNPTAGAGEAGMDVDGGGPGMGIMQGLFGGIARALAGAAQAHGQGQSTTPPGSPPAPNIASTATAPQPTTAQPTPTSTDPPAVLAPDGTLLLASDSSAAAQAQAQPRRTDSPARARTGTPRRVASGSVASVPRVNPSAPSTPVTPARTSASATSTPVRAGTSQPASSSGPSASNSAPQLSVRDDQLPIAALPFPLIPVPIPVAIPVPRAQAGAHQHAMPTPQQRLAAQIQQAQAQIQQLQSVAQPQQNRAGFNFTPLSGPGGRTLGGVFTFGPGNAVPAQPQPPVFGPVPPPGHPSAAVAHQPAPTNPFSFGPAQANVGGGMPRALADMMDMAMMGMQEGDAVELRPVAPLPRRARSVPPGGNAPGQAQEGAQGEGAAGERAPNAETRPNPARRKWAPPPPPGPTLRQRVEAAERARGARCDAVGCVYAPSDERPEGGVGGEMKGVEGCAHMFHGGCAGEGRCGVCEGGEIEVV